MDSLIDSIFVLIQKGVLDGLKIKDIKSELNSRINDTIKRDNSVRKLNYRRKNTKIVRPPLYISDSSEEE